MHDPFEKERENKDMMVNVFMFLSSNFKAETWASWLTFGQPMNEKRQLSATFFITSFFFIDIRVREAKENY